MPPPKQTIDDHVNQVFNFGGESPWTLRKQGGVWYRVNPETGESAPVEGIPPDATIVDQGGRYTTFEDAEGRRWSFDTATSRAAPIAGTGPAAEAPAPKLVLQGSDGRSVSWRGNPEVGERAGAILDASRDQNNKPTLTVAQALQMAGEQLGLLDAPAAGGGGPSLRDMLAQQQFDYQQGRDQRADFESDRAYDQHLVEWATNQGNIERQIEQSDRQIDLAEARDQRSIVEFERSRRDGLIRQRQQNEIALRDLVLRGEGLRADIRAGNANRQAAALEAAKARASRLLEARAADEQFRLQQEGQVARDLADFSRQPGDTAALNMFLQQIRPDQSLSGALAGGEDFITDQSLAPGAIQLGLLDRLRQRSTPLYSDLARQSLEAIPVERVAVPNLRRLGAPLPADELNAATGMTPEGQARWQARLAAIAAQRQARIDAQNAASAAEQAAATGDPADAAAAEAAATQAAASQAAATQAAAAVPPAPAPTAGVGDGTTEVFAGVPIPAAPAPTNQPVVMSNLGTGGVNIPIAPSTAPAGAARPALLYDDYARRTTGSAPGPFGDPDNRYGRAVRPTVPRYATPQAGPFGSLPELYSYSGTSGRYGPTVADRNRALTEGATNFLRTGYQPTPREVYGRNWGDFFRIPGLAYGGAVPGVAIVGDDPSGMPTGVEELVIQRGEPDMVIPLHRPAYGLMESVPRLAFGGFVGGGGFGGGSAEEAQLTRLRAMLQAAGERALAQSGYASVPTPVQASTPGLTNFERQHAGGLASSIAGVHPSVFAELADRARPTGVNQRVLRRGR